MVISKWGITTACHDGKHNDKATLFWGVSVGRPLDPLTRCWKIGEPREILMQVQAEKTLRCFIKMDPKHQIISYNSIHLTTGKSQGSLCVMCFSYNHQKNIGSMYGIHMLTWRGYMDGIHVTIYTIHGSNGISKNTSSNLIGSIHHYWIERIIHNNPIPKFVHNNPTRWCPPSYKLVYNPINHRYIYHKS